MKNLELFDDAGVDLRPQIRQIRTAKKIQHLNDRQIWKMTLREYAEFQVCGKPVADMSHKEIVSVSITIFKRVGWNPYWHPGEMEPIETHQAHVQEAIDDLVSLYEETHGLHGKSGRLVYRRVVEDAVGLGLPVPERVLHQEFMRR